MINWQIRQIELPLKYTWKISRNSSTVKLNSIVTVGNSRGKGMGEVAPNIRYHETPEKIQSEFERFLMAQPEKVHDMQDLEALLEKLDLPNALRFGIESAYIHYLCAADHTDIYTFLDLPKPGAVATSFSLPIMDVGEIAAFYKANHLERFHRIKIKVNAKSAVELIDAVSKVAKQPLIIDGNETWHDPDDVMRTMEQLAPYSVVLMEQPMPDGMHSEYAYLKPISPYPIFADESICAEADFDMLSRQFHGINMKLMKAGGYMNGMELLREARHYGMRTMVGCMVETTLGISSALHLCAGVDFVDLDGFLIVADEPFALVKEEKGMLMTTFKG